MKKQWISMIGIITFIFLLTACSDQQTDDESNQPTDQEIEHIAEPDVPGDSDDASNLNDESEKMIENDIEIDDDTAITALVNKQQSLAEDYEPDDLVTVEVPTVLENPEVNQLRKVAADALKEMFDQAATSDIYLHARSGYRSYETQIHLFNGYAENHGEEAANKYSAKPGESEHQTGLTMDITSESVDLQLTEAFGETKEGQWLKNHAHEFGFIIRYPENMEEITGYMYEPWHFRYLGVDLATNVYESGLTYEEYLIKVGIIDEVNANE